MTFPIDGTIPAAGNNPSADQPRMQTNFANIVSYVSVDHVAPGTTNTARYHDQVSFAINQAVAPGLGNGVGELFSNSQAGIFGTLSSLFFQDSSTNSRALTNLILSSSGNNYGITTPWGLIFNFGYLTNVQTTGTVLTFVTAMNGSQLFVGGTLNSNNAKSVSVDTFNSTSAKFYSLNNGANLYYLAIGT